MATSDFEQWTKTVVMLSRYSKPGQSNEQVGNAIAALRRHAERVAKHAENECNREVSAHEQRRAQAHQEAVSALLAEHFEGVRATFEGDPRGYVVKLHCRGGEYNTWGGVESGWGIA